MTNPIHVRPSVAADCNQLADIAGDTLFPSDMLEGMIAPFLSGDTDALWLSAMRDEQVVGFAFACVEPMTNGSWNLKAIGVMPQVHRSGIGRMLMDALEVALRKRAARVLVIDTASGADQEAARAFYPALGFRQTGVIPEFWDVGEDKVTFSKLL